MNDFNDQLKSLVGHSSFKPHRFILLLAVLELIQTKEIKTNKIYYDNKLKKIFSMYLKMYGDENDRDRPYTPFFHLKNSGFWHLQALEGREDVLATLNTVGGPGDLNNNVEYAYFSDSVYDLFTNKATAEIIKNEIVKILKYNNGRPAPLETKEENGLYAVEGSSSLFQHEEWAQNEIMKRVKSMGELLNNIYLYDGQSNSYYEYDTVFISGTGIYVVELKHWSGHIEVRPYKWIIDRVRRRADPHINNELKCRILKGIYMHNFRTYPNIWVESVVILTNPDASVTGASNPKKTVEDRSVHNPTFASITDFITYLRDREAKTKKVLNQQQVQAIADHINSLNNPRLGVQYTVPGYETIEYITQKPEYIELVARPTGSQARGLYRFRIFRPPYQASPEEKARFMKMAHNTVNAVSQIDFHPHIHQVFTVNDPDGDIIEGSRWSETGTLQSLMQEQGDGLDRDKSASICYGLALALAKAHELNVIHRAVKPQNVLMMNDVPKLINFDLAYQIEDNRLTVINDLSKLKDDGYIAPEMLEGQDIDEGTDYYSLGVIAYKLLVGRRPYAGTREFVASGGTLSPAVLQPLQEKGIPTKVITAIKGMVQAGRQNRLKDSKAIIDAFRSMLENDQDHVGHNVRLQPGSMSGLYEIIEFIDEGSEAQIYKAKTARGKEVIIKLFNREVPRERVFQEADIIGALQSSYIVRCEGEGYWNQDRFFIVLNYIDGETMRKKIDAQQRPDLKTFKSVALGLMGALEVLHQHRDEEDPLKPYVHGDVKPENIMITKDGKPVLIDFGTAGKTRTGVFEGTQGYVPPDNIKGADMQFTSDGDIFALGVTLWEWWFGNRPYEYLAVGNEPQRPKDSVSGLPKYIYDCLAKAVATTSDRRFGSVTEMQKAFLANDVDKHDLIKDTIIVEAEDGKETEAFVPVTLPADTSLQAEDVVISQVAITDVGNSFVKYLNTLFNASAKNENATAESQIGNPFFSKIMVDNPLVHYIYEKLLHERVNIILTGNAGDGKTTIAADIISKYTGQACTELNDIEELDEHKLVVVKDMSELKKVGIRTGILEDAILDQKRNYLIVSNTGTLLDSFRRLSINGRKASESELLLALEADSPQSICDENFLIINIGRIDSIETAINVFKRMLEQDNWAECDACNISNYCPVLTNVKMLQHTLETVCNRVSLLYRRLYEYNIRLTMRQMTGHLAFAITAGRECHDIIDSSPIALPKLALSGLFINNFFGDNGTEIYPGAMQLQPIRQIRKAEFGVALDPYFERETWLGEGGMDVLGGYVQDVGRRLLEQYMREKEKDQNGFSYRRQVRRMAYFFGSDIEKKYKNYLQTFLNSPMLLEFIKLTGDMHVSLLAEKNKYRFRVLQVLQEYFTGMRLPEGDWRDNDLHVTLNSRQVGSGTQMVLASFRTEDFTLKIKPRYQISTNNLAGEEKARKSLAIVYGEKKIAMDLDLPFLDFVERRYKGEVAEELSAYYTNRLEQFKMRLINQYLVTKKQHGPTLKLLRRDPSGTFKMMHIAVTTAGLEVL